jgi:CheY-like chemotaxis protein
MPLPQPLEGARKHRRRVLIVDDSSTHRLWLEMMLNCCYEVEVATDGPAGVQVALRTKPDLILLDVVMPGLDGLSVCRELRGHAETSGTPIILVTTQSGEWDVEAGYSSGCTDYILKPVDQVELLAKVGSWIDAAQPGCQA